MKTEKLSNLTNAIDTFNNGLNSLNKEEKGDKDIITEKIEKTDDKIVSKIDEIKNEIKKEVNNITIPEIPKEQTVKGEVKVKNIKDINFKPVIKAIEKIKIEKSKETKPIEMADYTLMLDDILKIIENPNGQIKELITLLSKMPTANYFDEIIKHIKQSPKINYSSTGRIRVAVDKVGGSSMKKMLMNASGNAINPATENKQDDIKTAIDDKDLIGNTQADGNGTKYHIATDNSGRLHTRSFKNAAGDGRRMLVDSDRHGQVDVLSLPDGITGFEVPAHDYIALTYIAAGNGAGEIETVVYKTGGSGGSIVATLTLAYNGDNEISSITKT